MISFPCPTCGEPLEAPTQYAGTPIRCFHCNTHEIVPPASIPIPRRRPPASCLRCGYSFAGHEDPIICPECAAPAGWRPPPSLLKRVIAPAILMVLGLSLIIVAASTSAATRPWFFVVPYGVASVTLCLLRIRRRNAKR